MNDKALKEIEIYFVPLSKYGIPNKLFYGLLILLVTFAFVINWKLSVFFAVILFPSFAQMHKEDMNAYKIFIQFIRSKTIGINPVVTNLINYKIG